MTAKTIKAAKIARDAAVIESGVAPGGSSSQRNGFRRITSDAIRIQHALKKEDRLAACQAAMKTAVSALLFVGQFATEDELTPK